MLWPKSGEWTPWNLKCGTERSEGPEEGADSFPFVPEVYSTSELFGSPFKPSLGAPMTMPHSASLEGLTPSSPAELRRVAPDKAEREDSLGEEWEVDEDGYIVEAVETFRFKVRADELERALRSRREMKVSGERGDGEERWDEDAFIMSKDMLDLLEGVQAQEDDAGKPVYRMEMDHDVLSKMVRRRGDGRGGCDTRGATGPRGPVDFRGSVGSRAVSRTTAGRKGEVANIVGGRQGGVCYEDEGTVFADPDEAAAAAISSATDKVQETVSMGNNLAQELPRGRRLNWFLSGVSRFDTASDLVGISAISAGLTAAVLLFDLASRMAVEHVGPRLLAAVRFCIVRVLDVWQKKVSPILFPM